MSSIAKLFVAQKDQFKNAEKSEVLMLIRMMIDPEIRAKMIETYMFCVGHTIKRGRIHIGVILLGTNSPEICHQVVIMLGMMNRAGAIKTFTDDGWVQFDTTHLDPEEREFIDNMPEHAFVTDDLEQDVAKSFHKEIEGLGTAASAFASIMNSTRPAAVSEPTTGGLVGGRLHST